MANSKLSADLLILKGVLLFSRCVHGYFSKSEQIAYYHKLYDSDLLTREDLERWVDELSQLPPWNGSRPDPEDEAFCDWMAEAEEAGREAASFRRDRDEWDDLWDDRARSCGATMW